MGFFDFLKPKQSDPPQVNSILPDEAKLEITKGRLPILRTNNIFLKKGEDCHYIDKAIYEKKNVKKRYVRNNRGYSMPGLFKGTRINMNNGQTDVVDNVSYEQIRGILYITNQRIIFVAGDKGFDCKIRDIIAVTPYANAVELQFSKDFYKIFVPDGNIVNIVLNLVQYL